MKKETITKQKTKDSKEELKKKPIIYTHIKKSKDIPKWWHIRKGCFWCKDPLLSFKEKVLRSCDNCAKKSLDGFDDIAHGKIKEGKDKVINTLFDNDLEQTQKAHVRIDNALNKKRKTIVKMAKNKGISEEDAIAAIKQLKA